MGWNWAQPQAGDDPEQLQPYQILRQQRHQQQQQEQAGGRGGKKASKVGFSSTCVHVLNLVAGLRVHTYLRYITVLYDDFHKQQSNVRQTASAVLVGCGCGVGDDPEQLQPYQILRQQRNQQQQQQAGGGKGGKKASKVGFSCSCYVLNLFWLGSLYRGYVFTADKSSYYMTIAQSSSQMSSKQHQLCLWGVGVRWVMIQSSCSRTRSCGSSATSSSSRSRQAAKVARKLGGLQLNICICRGTGYWLESVYRNIYRNITILHNAFQMQHQVSSKQRQLCSWGRAGALSVVFTCLSTAYHSGCLECFVLHPYVTTLLLLLLLHFRPHGGGVAAQLTAMRTGARHVMC
jgi:hypothetical protein